MSKLFQLLACLAQKELPKLHAFLDSPYFNTKASHLVLFQELMPFHPNYSQVDKKVLLQHSCPDERPHQQFINEQFSELSRLVEQFLVQQELKEQQGLQNKLQLHAFQARKMPDHFIKTFNKITEDLESRAPLHWEDSHHLWSAYHQLHTYTEGAMLFDSSSDRATPLHYLDQYFMMIKLRHICNQRAKRAYFKTEAKDLPFTRAIMEEAHNNNSEHPIIQLYAQMSALFEVWDYDSFIQTETQFRQVYALLEISERFFILLNLVNLANQQMNQGQVSLIHNIFKLYQHGANHQLFLSSKQLSTDTFLNICMVGAHVGESDWTSDFINQHHQLIKDKESNTVIQLGRAIFLFHSGQFNQAYDLMQSVKSNQIKRKLRIRSLSVRCLLSLHLSDMSYYRLLWSRVSNFSQFINRSIELSSKVKQSYRHFNQVVLKIAELKQHGWGQKEKHQALAAFIEQLSPLISKKWLLTIVRVERE